MENNLYEILEVSPNASTEVIEKAYKTLAKKYHPDTYKADKRYASSMIKKINNAYDILSNEEKRKEYDEQLKYEMQKDIEQKEEDLNMDNTQLKPSFMDKYIQKYTKRNNNYDKINRAIDEQYKKLTPKISNTVVVLILIGALVALIFVCLSCMDIISNI
ncbi:MAG: DnaJ domain-containing protein [Clostridia bacterium]|nr:DnaJ domain-containing protein [Clostridia bacterium]